ncbi:MAG: WD40/YVTN/BNR-like repeat-containing protein [Candidatus Zixiibacteriota bacterium]
MRLTLAFIFVLTAALTQPALAQDWETLACPVEDHISGLTFVQADTAFAVTKSGRCLRTYDGGISWSIFSVSGGLSLEDACFLDGKRGAVCGRNGQIHLTVDGGVTWEDNSWPDTAAWFFDIEFFDDKTAMVVGIRRLPDAPLTGIALRSTDSGRTWKEYQTIGMGYSEIDYRTGGPVYLLSIGKIHTSTDGGEKFKSRLAGLNRPARTISMFGATGIMAGPNGVCAYTRDSGVTWNQTALEQELVVVASQMVDEKTGYIAGKDGLMMVTTDGGKNWQKEEIDPTMHVLDLCLGGDNLYAVGGNGKIIFKKVR